MREEKEPATLRPDEQGIHVAMVASAVVDELSRRYSIEPNQVMEAITWYREHKEFVNKLKHSGYLTIIGTLIGASLLVAWEGVKAYLRKVIE